MKKWKLFNCINFIISKVHVLHYSISLDRWTDNGHQTKNQNFIADIRNYICFVLVASWCASNNCVRSNMHNIRDAGDRWVWNASSLDVLRSLSREHVDQILVEAGDHSRNLLGGFVEIRLSCLGSNDFETQLRKLIPPEVIYRVPISIYLSSMCSSCLVNGKCHPNMKSHQSASRPRIIHLWIHSWIHIAPLQENYLEVLPTAAR